MNVLSLGASSLLGIALATLAQAQSPTQKEDPTQKPSAAPTVKGASSPRSALGTSQLGGGMIFVSTDNCSSPTAISGEGSHPLDTTSATTSGFDGGGACASGASSINQDRFWQWTATAAGDYQFDTFGSTFDTKLSVHAGVACAALCVGYNDDTSGLQSRVRINGINNGDTFVLQVGGFGSASGTGVLNITQLIPPPNDTCGSATPISGTGSTPFSTVVANTSGFNGGGTCASGASSINQDVFFQWTANAAGNYSFDTFGSSFDTKLSVHAGAGCAATCVEYNDDTSGLQSRVIVNGINAGDTFLVQVGGFGSASGTGTLNIDLLIPPTNDTCGSATAISGIGSHAFNSFTASTSSFTGGGSCGAGADTINQDVFWQWTATAAGDYTFNTFGSSFNTKLSVHAGVGCAAVCVGYNENAVGLQSQVLLFGINAGDTFLVQVGGSGSAAGSGTLNVDIYIDPCALPPDSFEPNDDCPQAVPIGDGVYNNLNVSKTDWDYYEVQVADGDTLTVDLLFSHSNGDIDVFLYGPGLCQTFGAGNVACTGSLACGFSASDNESISWTNTTGVTQTYTIKVNVYPPTTTGDCNSYDLIISGAGGGIATGFCPGDGTAGTCPCTNPGNPGHGCANQLGSPGGLLTASGSASVAAADLVLSGSDLEPGQFGLFFQGTTQLNGGNGFPLGDGLLCVGGQVIRLQAVPVNAFGQTATTLNLVTAGNISVGHVRGYQLWYRNTATTPCGLANNLTNALLVTWVP